MKASYNISVFVTNSPTEYSGGRYASLMLAEALAMGGHRVRYATNNKPVFYDDFRAFPHHKDLKLSLTDNFLSNLPAGTCHIAVVVPGMDKTPEFYDNVLYYTRLRRTRVVLLNFEDPLWFNALAPEPRDVALWDNWVTVSKHASLILSISREGSTHAKKFYTACPENAVFDFVYPAINHFAADAVQDVAKERRIVLLTRFSNAPHKGGPAVPNLISEAMRGYVLVLVVGSGKAPPDVLRAIDAKAKQHGVQVEVKFKLSDEEKFREIKRASLLLFPSFFEGFGYPPVEAQYCNVPSIAFDLPVLREHSDKGVYYVPRGDWAAFTAKIGEVLAEKDPLSRLRDNILHVASIENMSTRLDNLMELIMRRPLPAYASRAGSRRGLRRLFARRA